MQVALTMILLFAMSSAAFASNRFDSDNVGAIEWKVMVYIDGRGDLDHAARCTLGQLLSLPATNAVDITVQLAYDGLAGSKPGEISQVQATCNFNRTVFTVPYWRGVRRFALGADRQLPGDYVGDFNMQSQDRLQNFVSWSLTNDHSKHLMFIFWSHGEGIPFVEAWIQSEFKDHHKIPFIGNKIRIPGWVQRQVFMSHLESDSVLGGRLLLNSEIDKALAAALTGRKLDVIGFDACFKGMLETGYAMSNIADQMIGSEAAEPDYGWDYSDWLATLLKNPTLTPLQLGRTIVDSYLTTSSEDVVLITLSVVDLKMIADLTAALDLFSNYLMKHPMLWSQVHDARRRSFAYDLHEVDLIKFAESFQGMLGSTSGLAETQNLRIKLGNAILYPRHNNAADEYGSAGLAIYFPACLDEYKLDPYHKRYDPSSGEAIPFAADHAWAPFLLTYFASREAVCP